MAKKKSAAREHIVYHRDGSVWAKGPMLDGVCHGYWEWFRKGGGAIMRSGSFDHGVQIGAWTTYDRNGEVYKVTQMKPKEPAAAAATAKPRPVKKTPRAAKKKLPAVKKKSRAAKTRRK